MAASASDSLRELEASRREKIETGEYREAGGLQKKIEKLKLSEDKRFRQVRVGHLERRTMHFIGQIAFAQELETKHRDQLQELKKKQDDEQAAFELKWQETFDRLKNEAKETENAMKKKHEEETVKSKDINPGGASTMSPKWSSKLLDLRKSEESLLRMHEFIKAAKVKDAADLLEEKELKAILEKNKNLGKAEAAQLSHQQKLEMDVLRQRHKTAKDEATVTLKKEVEILSKKFKVERQEMDKMHSLEKTDLEEAIKGW